MKYLIFDRIGKRFRTRTNWVKSPKELFEGEKMLSFNSREEADNFIENTGTFAASSYGISPSNEFFKFC